MVKMLAPILSFTADEIWKAMPHRKEDDAENVAFNQMAKPYTEYQLDVNTMYEFGEYIKLRDDINLLLEEARSSKLIGKPLEAAITLYCDDAAYAKLENKTDMIKMITIVSDVKLVKGSEGKACEHFEGVSAVVTKAEGEKCERCWMYSHEVGSDSEHPTLCPRCASVVKA